MMRTLTLLAVAFVAVSDGYAMGAVRVGAQRGVAPRFAAAASPLRTAAVMSPRSSVLSMQEAAADAGESVVMRETPQRSLVKAIGWRFTAGVVTAITSMIFTGSMAAMLAIGEPLGLRVRVRFRVMVGLRGIYGLWLRGMLGFHGLHRRPGRHARDR